MASGIQGRFEQKTAIVTAASRGIGLAIARRLVDEGARVVVTARGEAVLEDAVTHLGGAAHALGIAGHADDVAHQAEVVRRTLDTFGSVDLLVNNAGINPAFGPAIDVDLGAARKMVDVNALGALSWAQQVHRGWMRAHGGAIVNIASVAGRRPAPGIGMYGATKAMLIALTELLALELAPDIRVNAVAPGVVKTAFARALYERDEHAAAARYPLGRLGVPDDVAGIVAFLLSDEASWITGETVTVDGGLLLTGGA